MAKGADTVKAMTELYNTRDFDRWRECFAEDAVFVDLAQGITAKGHDEILAYGQTWIAALSDAAYADVRIVDAGGTVTMQFNGEGVNDGPFGTFPATGKRISAPFVNVITTDADGRVTRIEQLYDRLDILTQLGHVPPD